MKKKKPTRKKYATGTSINNYMENPYTELMQNQINNVKAQEEAATNPLYAGMKAAGNAAMQVGISEGGFDQLTKDEKGNGVTGVANSLLPLLGNMQFAFGGVLPGPGKDGVKDDRKLTDQELAALKAKTGVGFDRATADRLFGVPSSLKEIGDINLGKYKDVNYFNVKRQGNGYMLDPTTINPQNAQGYKSQLDEIRKLNPEFEIGENYLDFGERMAYGGGVGNVPVEIEGDEVGETPDGQVFEAKGPSHEQGGIDIDLPGGTEMFSKRISIDGKTMAERKKARERKTAKLEKLLGIDPTDTLTKNSLKRTGEVNSQQEELDKEVQKLVKATLDQETKEKNNLTGTDGKIKLADGGPVPYVGPGLSPEMFAQIMGMTTSPSAVIGGAGTTNTVLPGTEQNGFTPPTMGDVTGAAGNLISSFGPYLNTLSARAGDTPNINAFEEYGTEGLMKLDESKQYIDQIKDEKLQDLRLNQNAAMRRGRNTSRGVNQMRAMDLATQMQGNAQTSEIQNQFSEAMMNILSQESQMENQQDSMVMQGEQARDLADRQDRDNFFSNKAKNIANMGEGIQSLGKNMNIKKSNDESLAMIERLKLAGMTEAEAIAMIEYMQNLAYTNPKLTKTATKK